MRSPDVYLSQFHSWNPPYKLTQSDSLKWLANIHNHYRNRNTESVEPWLKRYGVTSKRIQTRRFVCNDMTHHSVKNYEVFHEVGIRDHAFRSDFFQEKATDIFSHFYPSPEGVPHHLIHVTCTGYSSPSPPQRLFSHQQVQVNITHAYHMGCYAALPSVRMGEGFLAAAGLSSQRVDIVHTEMCSLHIDPQTHTPEQLVVQSLFADGAIKYSLTSQPLSDQACFRLIALEESLIPESSHDMRWEITSWGMKMTLMREVPKKILSYILPFMEKLTKHSEVSLGDLLKNALFAVHPGGPSILDGVYQTLGLQEFQICDTEEIFRNHGNMSSATLPHIWKNILENCPEPRWVVSLGFGPGLTLFGGLFQMVIP